MKRMGPLTLVIGTLIGTAACGTSDEGDAGTAWIDPAPHTEGFVSISPGVRLHYLDFGGRGEVLLFLAGAGNSAHVFDTFAPRFVDGYRVLALTRRGYGASSQPASGYDSKTLAADIVTVLDQLGITRAHLAGHSIAGGEMTQFAGDFPDRLDRLVYLDSAYDRADWPKDVQGVVPPDPTKADYASPAAFNDYLYRTQWVRFPESELRATGRWSLSGRYEGDVTPPAVSAALVAGANHHLDYSKVRVPALAMFTYGESVSDLAPWLSRDSKEWAQAQLFLDTVLEPYQSAQRGRFLAEVAQGRVVDLRSPHYLFLTIPDEVAMRMKAFLAEE